MAAKPIPDGFHSLTPYLVVDGANKLIDFVKEAFGAEEIHRSSMPDGRVMHAQVRIGDSFLMMGQSGGEHKPMPAMLYYYVDDTDAAYQRALAAGGVSIMEPADQFYGDRNAGIRDPFGNQWWIATHVEDVAPEELETRAKAAMSQRKSA